MKKLLCAMLATLLIFSLTSCGSDAFKGTWVGTDELGSSDVTIEFDGAGKITNFQNSEVQSSGTYTDNKDGTITLTIEAFEEPITYVYDANDINSGILMLHDVLQVSPGYVLHLQ